MASFRRSLSGFGWFTFASLGAVSIAACGGGDSGGGGGDGDAGEAASAGESGSSGSSNGGSDNGGSSNGGSSNGGSSNGGSDSGGTSNGGSATGATGPALDRVEEACELDCNAQYELSCTNPNTNVLTCKAQCAAATAQLGDFCLLEYAALIECRGEGGYDCVQDRPYPRSTCATQQLTFSECTTNLGCKRSCKKSVDESCTSMSLDECIDDCIGQGTALPMDCSYYWDGIAACRVSAEATCVDGELTTPEACASTVMRVAECIYDETTDGDMCEGWCWAANTLGCGGDDCAADCAEKLADATCGTAFSDMLDCALFFGDAACSGSTFMSNGICDSEAMTYTMCTSGGT